MVVYLLYGLIAVYLVLAFFTTCVQQSCALWFLADHYRDDLLLCEDSDKKVEDEKDE
ncbi:MAG: hypothetical protein ACLR08_07545 [Dorea longicatena]